MKRSILLFVLCACTLCFGCKTISNRNVKVDLESPYRDIKTLAVMRFDDGRIQGEAVKGYIVKEVSNPDAGVLLADIMSGELTRWGKYHVLTHAEIKRKMKDADAHEEELVKWKDSAALGKILGVDAVVIGKIEKFGFSNMAVYGRGNVSFTAECIDTQNGNVFWSLAVDESVPFRDEIELANKIVKESVEKLKGEVD